MKFLRIDWNLVGNNSHFKEYYFTIKRHIDGNSEYRYTFNINLPFIKRLILNSRNPDTCEYDPQYCTYSKWFHLYKSDSTSFRNCVSRRIFKSSKWRIVSHLKWHRIETGEKLILKPEHQNMLDVYLKDLEEYLASVRRERGLSV